MVTLITRSVDLEDAMLADYPGIIIPAEQYENCSSMLGFNYYKFKNLEENELLKFLECYKHCDYMVLSEDKPIILNRVKEANVWLEVLQEMTANNLTSSN